jgi:hypothetical protein
MAGNRWIHDSLVLPDEEAKLLNSDSHRLETLSARAATPQFRRSFHQGDFSGRRACAAPILTLEPIRNRPYRRTDDLYIEVLSAEELTDNTLITFSSDLH